MSTKLTQAQLAAYLAQIRAIMDKHGFAVQGAGGDETHVSLAYTVGLSQTTPYELFITGLPMATAHGLLNSIAELVKRDAMVLNETVVFDSLANFPLRVRLVPYTEARHRCPVVTHLCRDNAVTFAQIVWPDKTGKFPGEEGCDATTVSHQL